MTDFKRPIGFMSAAAIMAALAAATDAAKGFGRGITQGKGVRRVAADTEAGRRMINGQNRTPKSWKCQASAKHRRRHTA